MRPSGPGDPEQPGELGTHDRVALARGGLEPGPIEDLHVSAVVFDETPVLEMADGDPDALPRDAQHERQEFLGQEEGVALGAIVGRQKPAGTTPRDRVEPVARGVLRRLHEERLRVRPKQRRQAGPLTEGRLESSGGDAQRLTVELRHQVERRAVGAEEDRQADHALVSDGRDLCAEPLGHEGDNRDHAASREVRMLERLSRTRDDEPSRQVYDLEPGVDAASLCRRHRREQVIAGTIS